MSDSIMNDGTFTRRFTVMVLAMIALTFFLIVLAGMASNEVAELRDAQTAIENSGPLSERIAPVGKFAAQTVSEAVAPAAQAKEMSGEEAYNSSCASCHASGVAGAPAVGAVDAWSARIAQGADTLYDHALNGFQSGAGFMPAKGGNTALTGNAVKSAVDYMIEKSK